MFSFLRRKDFSRTAPVVVVFAGGMGAQILNAAAYFYLKSQGREVYADLSYFRQAERIAEIGKHGDCSHWAWRLDAFGLMPAAFSVPPFQSARNTEVLKDGARMVELALDGLSRPSIRGHFAAGPEYAARLPSQLAPPFLCVHIRRGDFVNVASHLIGDEEFVALTSRFSGLLGQLVVVSDSPIRTTLRTALGAHFERALFLDDIDPLAAHLVMRNARILVCSNSTFSLTAAALNPDALVVIPKQWYGGKDRQIEAPIQSRCLFQIWGEAPK